MSLRVFVDTSVLCSAVHAAGSARELVAEASDREVGLISSAYVLNEVTRNLAAKSEHRLDRLTIVLASGTSAMVEEANDAIERMAGLVDPKDAPTIAAAIAARAPIVATYDQRHLLSRADESFAAFGVEVLTPQDILDRMAAAE